MHPQQNLLQLTPEQQAARLAKMMTQTRIRIKLISAEIEMKQEVLSEMKEELKEYELALHGEQITLF